MKRYINILTLIFTLSFLWGCLKDPEVYKIIVKTDSTVEFVQGGISVNGGIYLENEEYLPTIESCGFCYGVAEGPTLSNSVVKVKNPGIGDFNTTLKSLHDGTKYYVRAFAQNKYGVVYGEEVSFVSLTKPTVKTLSLSEDNENSQLIVECELESLGSGEITELGVCYSSANKLPNKENDEYKLVSNIQKGKYTVSILVEPNSKYYVRAFATNLAGVAYGEVKEILTTEATYTIKFDSNGGSGNMEDISTLQSKDIQLTSNSFTRTGYTFIGWNTKADGSGTTYYDEQNISIDSDITLYAQWTSLYTITFNANGGSGSMSSKTVSVGSSIYLPINTFTRSGYEFVGWNTSSDGFGAFYTNGQTITPSRNIILYAQWKKKEYTITFNSNGGGGSMSSKTVSAGSTVSLPANSFIRSGYEFVGWNTNADGSGVSYTNGQNITPSGNITFYAQWKKIDENKEHVSGSHQGHDYVDLGLPSGTLWATCNVGASRPEGYGDYFAWGETETKSSYTSSNYTYSNNSEVLPLTCDAANVNWGGDWRMPTKTEQEELRNSSYTIWTWTVQNFVTGYRVTSKINGNSIFLPAAGVMSSSLNEVNRYGNYWSSSYGVDYPVGLYFKSEFVHGSGFYSHQGLSVRPVIPVNSSVEPEQPTLYTITFNGNGGIGSMSSMIVNASSSVTLPSNKFTQSGYSFTGWNTKTDGSGDSYTNGQNITPSRDITLYAQWKEVYTITFDSNGGRGGMSPIFTEVGTSITLPTNTFTRNGYVFIGWSTSSYGYWDTYYNEQSFIPSENMTLYAMWEEEVDTIIFYDVEARYWRHSMLQLDYTIDGSVQLKYPSNVNVYEVGFYASWTNEGLENIEKIDSYKNQYGVKNVQVVCSLENVVKRRYSGSYSYSQLYGDYIYDYIRPYVKTNKGVFWGDIIHATKRDNI